MFLSKNFSLRKAFSSFSRTEKIFIFSAMACAFFISFDYGIVRPAINSIFIGVYGVKYIPYAWIVTIPLNFFVIYLYNRCLPKWGCWKTFVVVCLSVILMNFISAFYLTEIPFFPFIQCIWKDIYILLMFKQLWSLIHTTINTDKAKFLYGLLFGIGGLGSVVGSLVPSFFAVDMGSQKLFLFSVPVYLLLMVFYRIAIKKSRIDPTNITFKDEASVHLSKSGFNLIKNSSLLTYVLLIVVFMQMSIAFVDFQFNIFLEKAIPLVDPRTAYAGRINGIINATTFTFQFLGGFIFLHFLGLKKCHYLVPMMLFGNGIMLLFLPSFGMISYAYASIKTMDYSVFNIAREMLYIPMRLDEKFRAKAIIDVFAYRSARGVASIMILLIQVVFPLSVSFILGWLALVVMLIWMFVLSLLFKKHDYSAKGELAPASE